MTHVTNTTTRLHTPAHLEFFRAMHFRNGPANCAPRFVLPAILKAPLPRLCRAQQSTPRFPSPPGDCSRGFRRAVTDESATDDLHKAHRLLWVHAVCARKWKGIAAEPRAG